MTARRALTARLRALAGAATPGPRRVEELDVGLYVTGGSAGDPLGLAELSDSDAPDPHADAAFWAALDPATVTALLDVVEAAAALDEWLKARTGQPAEAFALRRALRALAARSGAQEAGA